MGGWTFDEGNKNLWVSLLSGLFLVVEVWVNFRPVGEGLPPSPSRENFIAPLPPQVWKIWAPHLAKLSLGRWKFKVPQSPIKLSPLCLPGGKDSMLSKKFLDIQATIECGFTLKHVHNMIRTYSQTPNKNLKL